MATDGPPGERRLRGAGIYPRAAMLNHDCLPNLARFASAVSFVLRLQTVQLMKPRFDYHTTFPVAVTL